MSREVRHTLDKGDWRRGEWVGEPDEVRWVDADTDLDCAIIRNSIGALCGYVGVAESHPWHGVEYHRCLEGCDEPFCGHAPEDRVRVHGGLTYSGERTTPMSGRPGRLWWFGFDCAHAWDVVPEHYRHTDQLDSVYRSLTYVEEEVGVLAKQLRDVAE